MVSANVSLMAHLMRRAAFGAPAAELEVLAEKGYDAVVDDLRKHDAAEEVVMMVFSEFGRRIQENGSGTDHGSGGGAFMIGERVNGAMYGEYPSLAPEKQLNGDLRFNNDFRCLYSTALAKWMGMDPDPIVNGTFDQFETMLKQPVA